MSCVGFLYFWFFIFRLFFPGVWWDWLARRNVLCHCIIYWKCWITILTFLPLKLGATTPAILNYVVDKNIILGLNCLADVIWCVGLSVLILARCLNPCSFVSKNIWKMRIKFAKIPRDLLIMGCWVLGEGGGGEGIKNTAIIWSPPLTKYSVILARHPRYTGDLYRVIMTGNILLRTSVTQSLLFSS